MGSETNTIPAGQTGVGVCLPEGPVGRAETSTLRLSLFSSPDVTQREVLEDVVSTRLQQARALIDAGDLRGARRVLAEVRTDFRTYTRAHPDAEVTPRLARLFATIQLYHGEVWDRRDGEGAHARAVEIYQAALRTADTAVALDPRDPESLLIRSEIRHLLSDYGPAMADAVRHRPLKASTVFRKTWDPSSVRSPAIIRISEASSRTWAARSSTSLA